MPPPKVVKKKRLMDQEEKKTTLKSFCKGVLVHGGLLLVVCIYAIGGAYIFIAIEKDGESERIQTKKTAAANIKSSREYIVQNSWYLSDKEMPKDEFIFTVKRNLNLYHNFLVVSATESYYDGKPNQWNYDWTFSKSLLFTVTTMGAIGYGHISPTTWMGQFFCIYYGMIGVPLLLLFLANIGDFLASSLRYMYSRLICRWCRIRRVVSELKPSEKLKPKILWDEKVGFEEYMDTDYVQVPIVVNMLLIFVYLMIGGVIFHHWEHWQMYESIYFSFITLTTIGFGDYVPGNSFLTDDADQVLLASLKMIVTIVYCMFGMALVSMAINLMQEQLVEKTKWMAKELGITSDEEDQSYKYNVKKHEPGSIMETPPDRDGNQPRIKNAYPDEEKKEANWK